MSNYDDIVPHPRIVARLADNTILWNKAGQLEERFGILPKTTQAAVAQELVNRNKTRRK